MLLKVYYLDDEEALCENFVDYFTSPEVVVSTFTDPLVAIETIKKNPPDIFFVDYRMPGMSGDEVAKVLDPKLPKYLITGELDLKTEYKFDKVLSKPYDEADIAGLISSLITDKKTA
jgi:CheY-like chemotaxis protein